MSRVLLIHCLAFLLGTTVAACSDDSSGVGGTAGSAGSGGASGSSGTGGSSGAGGASGTGGSAGTGGLGGAGGIGGAEPQRPDLTVRSIGDPKVSCPGGAGTCVTTVDIAIENLGAGDAPGFNFEVTLDPNQAVIVPQAVPGGLGAGITQLITIATPPGGNCFDPDCSISVLVDDLNDVVESDETNNTSNATFEG